MAVHTHITKTELKNFLATYDVGELIDFKGIYQGITNTNYKVTSTSGNYILTIFEQNSAQELAFYMQLNVLLAKNGIGANVIANRDGQRLAELYGKPAALMQWLDGHDVTVANITQSAQIGQALATLHHAFKKVEQQPANSRDLVWCQTTAEKVMSKLTAEDKALLISELAYQSQQHVANATKGIIHADLFLDNILFQQNKLIGVIDIYYACYDYLLFDLAVCVNDCCFDGGVWQGDKQQALCAAYRETHPLSQTELKYWPVFLRRAALRYWISRLWDFYYPADSEHVPIKDPDAMKNILLFHQEHSLEFAT